MDNLSYEAHLRRVLERGKLIVPALRAFRDELPAGRRRQIEDVIGVLEQGDLQEAMAAVRTLPDYWIPLLSATTSTNDHERLLREFMEESQKAAALRRQWWLVMSYTMVVLAIAALVIVMFAFLIVPTFRDIFNDFEVELPSLTVVVLNVAHWITSGQVLIAAGIVAVAALLIRIAFRAVPQSVRNWWTDRWGTRIGRSTHTARFCYFMADLLETGMSVQDAVQIAGVACKQSRLQRRASEITKVLEPQMEAAALVKPPRDSHVLTHTLTSDMPTASRICVLRELGSSYLDRIRFRVAWASGVFEPLAICLVGALVGLTVVGLFLPLVKLVQSLT